MSAPFFRASREAWPSIVDGLSRLGVRWEEEWVQVDLDYWRGEAERAALGLRHNLPRRGARPKLSRSFCQQRWGWNEKSVRMALKASDPMSALNAKGQLRASSGPAQGHTRVGDRLHTADNRH